MAVTGSGDISAPVNRVLSTKFLKDARALCHYFLGSRPGDVMPSHRGTYTMLFRRYDNLTPTTTALTELSAETYPTRTATQVSVTDVTASVSKYGAHALLTEDLILRDLTQASVEIAEVFAVQGGRSLNRLQRNVLEDNLTIIYANGASDGAVTDTVSRLNLANLINTLQRNTAMPFTSISTGSTFIGTQPIFSAYYGFCHPDVAYDIENLTGFVSATKYAAHQPLVSPNEFGSIDVAGTAIRFMRTEEASADTDSGGTPTASIRSTSGSAADLYTTVVIGQMCHGALSLDANLIREVYKAGDPIPGLMMIEQGLGSAGTADPLREYKSIGWKAWHGGAILNSAYGRGLRSAASKLT